MDQEHIIPVVKAAILLLGWFLATKSILSKDEDSFFFTLHKGSRLNRLMIFALVTMTFAFIGLFLFIQDMSLIETWIQYFMGGAGGSGAIQTLRKFSPDQKEYVAKSLEVEVEKAKVVDPGPVPAPTPPFNDSALNEAYCMQNGDTVLHMIRYAKFSDRVIGRLSVRKSESGVSLSQHTLEDVTRSMEDEDDKVWGQTAIPPGWYELKIHDKITPMTSRFRKRSDMKWFTFFIEVINVPFFSNIYFHLGNFPKDTDGCILTGKGLSCPVAEGVIITESAKAMKEFYEAIYPILQAEKRVFIFIENSFYEPK
jgi:hypothetical protein